MLPNWLWIYAPNAAPRSATVRRPTETNVLDRKHRKPDIRYMPNTTLEITIPASPTSIPLISSTRRVNCRSVFLIRHVTAVALSLPTALLPMLSQSYHFAYPTTSPSREIQGLFILGKRSVNRGWTPVLCMFPQRAARIPSDNRRRMMRSSGDITSGA